MVVFPASFGHQRKKDLLNETGKRQRNTQVLCRRKGVLKVLMVELDLEAGLKIPSEHHWRLCLQNLTSCQSSPDGLVDQLRIKTCFCSEGKCLSDSSDIRGDDDLVHQFNEPASADPSDSDNVLSDSIKNVE